MKICKKKTPLPETDFQGRERSASWYHLNLSAPHGSRPLQVRRGKPSILWRCNGRSHRSLTQIQCARCAAPRPFSCLPSAPPSTNRGLSVPIGQAILFFSSPFACMGLVYTSFRELSSKTENIFCQARVSSCFLDTLAWHPDFPSNRRFSCKAFHFPFRERTSCTTSRLGMNGKLQQDSNSGIWVRALCRPPARDVQACGKNRKTLRDRGFFAAQLPLSPALFHLSQARYGLTAGCSAYL